jgi:glycosyltransferase involved in cell wall biosynthesis
MSNALDHELSMMKKVLVIAYHYPPLGGGGVFRTLKFTKYLPQFGFKPYVLTVKNAMYHIRDPSLLEDIHPEVRVIRTFSWEHKLFAMPFYRLRTTPKWIFIPEINIGWLPFAVYRGKKLIEEEGIDIIYATAPVYTSLLIGYLIKRKTGKPLVIDFRDPWTDNPFAKYPTKLHERIEKKMEEKIVTSADYVIVVDDPMKNSFIKKYPLTKSKIEVITNGFDPGDFKNLKIYKQTNKFRITYTGSLYGMHTANSFLIALKKLTEEKAHLREELEVMFIGNYGRETALLVKKFGLEDVVKLVRYMSHSECIEIMLNSDTLLLLITEDWALTGKLFEYLASRRPILAIAPEKGVAANIIRSIEAGMVVPPDNIELIKEAIFNFYEMWKQGKLVTTTGDITKYDRVFLTQRLAKIFDLVLNT